MGRLAGSLAAVEGILQELEREVRNVGMLRNGVATVLMESGYAVDD